MGSSQVSGPILRSRDGGAAEGNRVLVTLLVLTLATSWASGALAIAVTAAIVATFFVAYLLRSPHERGAAAVILILSLYWGLLIFHPNVPSVYIGSLGWRKSCLFLLGIGLGVLWYRSRTRLLRPLWLMLIVAMACSIAVHLFLPGIEAGIARSADVSTGQIQGRDRMQGLFAGPFHVAMAGCFLFILGIFGRLDVPKKADLVLRIASLAIGLACIWLAQTRTAYVVVALGVLLFVIRSLTSSGGVARLVRTVLWVGIAVTIVLLTDNPLRSLLGPDNTIVVSLANIENDQRFTNRFDTWQHGLSAFWESPVVGWGSGSAGDTLGAYFLPSGVHVTSHNLILKYLVEGGILGGIVVILLGCWLAIRVWRENCSFALAALVSVIGFGLTGSSVEAIPVSVVLGAFIGLSAVSNRVEAPPYS